MANQPRQSARHSAKYAAHYEGCASAVRALLPSTATCLCVGCPQRALQLLELAQECQIQAQGRGNLGGAVNAAAPGTAGIHLLRSAIAAFLCCTICRLTAAAKGRQRCAAAGEYLPSLWLACRLSTSASMRRSSSMIPGSLKPRSMFHCGGHRQPVRSSSTPTLVVCHCLILRATRDFLTTMKSHLQQPDGPARVWHCHGGITKVMQEDVAGRRGRRHTERTLVNL